MFFCGKFLPLGDRKKGLENLTKEILGFKKKIAINNINEIKMKHAKMFNPIQRP
jgi:hypothetical protein